MHYVLRLKRCMDTALVRKVIVNLCRKQSLSEMVTYLKSQTKYSGVLEDINVRNVHRRQVEAALNKEYFERCARLMKYAPKKNQDFYSQEVIGIEVQLIVDKVVSIKEKDQAEFFFGDI